MNSAKILVISTSVFLLVGCAPLGDFPEIDEKANSSAIASTSISSKPITPVHTASPEPSESDVISWELYPGLQTKVDQLFQEKNCEALKGILDEFSNKEEALSKYLQKVFKEASCE